ncbi:MAG: hypothetical protein JWR11_3908 [Mycobacterium sp.]|jgi:hypothetical protein|nr:hypothetical protein [Mycobacterium sp.]MDT5176026.1 hypothetical protein [Mycobacterium sp.]
MAGRLHHRGLGFALALAAVALVGSACDSGTVVNTDDARPTTQTSTSAPPPLAAPPNNDGLANAFDYAAPQADAETAYYFTSPSKRWVCAIIPRDTAGCQSATGSTIPVKGAPDTVTGQDGTDAAPNAIQVGRDADPQFATLDSPGYSLVPGPAAVLPFNKVLIVSGFRCNVQEATGISCASELTGKGFTFSADGVTWQYTDLPA